MWAMSAYCSSNDACFRVWGSGYRVEGSGYRIQGTRLRVEGTGFRFRVQDSRFRVQCTGFRVQGAGFRVQESGIRDQGWGLDSRGRLLSGHLSTLLPTDCQHNPLPTPDSEHIQSCPNLKQIVSTARYSKTIAK